MEDQTLEVKRLKVHAAELSVALDHYDEMMHGPISVGPLEGEECVYTEMYQLMRFITRHRMARTRWVGEIASSGLIRQLARVINFIPLGYKFDTGPYKQNWAVIHQMVRELLPEENLAEYDEDVDGYSPGAAYSWGLLYKEYKNAYPPAELPKEIATRLEFIDRWTHHLEEKEDQGWRYRRRNDEYYADKFHEYIETFDPDYYSRPHPAVDSSDYVLAGLDPDDYSEESAEQLSSDADHEVSSKESISSSELSLL